MITYVLGGISVTKEEKNSTSPESTQEKATTTTTTTKKAKAKVQEKTKSSQKETQEKDPSEKKKSPPASKKKTEKTKQETSKKEATSSKENKNSDKKEKETRNTETFAIIQSGGKQYKVSEGTILDIEYIEIEPKKKIEFKEILLVHSETETKIGQPFLKDTKVTASVLNQIKSPKIIVFKFKRKTGYKKTQGHRQLMTTVKIEKI